MTPRAPDPAWVVTLKEGDRVAVADLGTVVYEAVVRRRTPSGRLRVGHPADNARFLRTFNPGGYQRDVVYHCRYLVPVESKP